ncbi:MAG TPA: hydantoinase/oxoprolinase family protein [Nitrospinota bacterium]|jgi:N-methylhydantoinase A|nr:hydantoinase/oxoprolinase family protein [Nitrospinota bacterium]MDP7502652.1 hydantoinase/oxoprolinase family protein [Nitrospinota bacterium]MDP7664786.1 hydantoinase/oxoprolinase family protein [Nitrospinota bacterium]HJP14016.1 hydantoinase/oxoprolinase family protein [Nitrospinota bacterium]
MRFAVDTGGTFTDLVMEDDKGVLHMFKAATTPDDPVRGILDVVASAADSLSLSPRDLLSRGDLFIHGTTYAINAIITGNTARTAFLTTKGHPDVLVLREGGRIEPFNFLVPFPKPYIPRALTFEVPERITSAGEVAQPLDEAAAIEIIKKLKSLKVESVGVCFLWSTVNPAHEDRIAELLEENLPGAPYTLSHVLNPILREYRRASSACMDASLKPLMNNYLGGLSERLSGAGFSGRLLMLTSQGGVMDVRDLIAAPIHAIGSGPSMAPIAGRHFARADTKSGTAIVADTGGTTYDVSLVRRGTIPTTPETWIGQRYRGHIVGFPSVDVKSIGAGGGSIAWVDEGGLLHVGPQSAGAVPGPACYGRGGERPTVTDASLVLGHIDPAYFLGGAMALDSTKAENAIRSDVAKPLNLSLEEAAEAILRLATENMVGAIEEITIDQGIDPRGAVLVGGGGAAGLNSVAIARRLGCERVIIPEVGAALSAAGALMSDLHADFRALHYSSSVSFDFGGVNATLKSLAAKCKAFFKGPGAGALDHSIEIFAEARYRHQIWEIDLPIDLTRFKTEKEVARVRREFDAAHEEIFAVRDPDSDVEFVGWRAVARCKLRAGRFGKLGHEKKFETNLPARRKAYFEGKGRVNTRVELFESMKPGAAMRGPAIIESPFTTVVVDPGARVVRTRSGSLVIEA